MFEVGLLALSVYLWNAGDAGVFGQGRVRPLTDDEMKVIQTHILTMVWSGVEHEGKDPYAALSEALSAVHNTIPLGREIGVGPISFRTSEMKRSPAVMVSLFKKLADTIYSYITDRLHNVDSNAREKVGAIDRLLRIIIGEVPENYDVGSTADDLFLGRNLVGEVEMERRRQIDEARAQKRAQRDLAEAERQRQVDEAQRGKNITNLAEAERQRQIAEARWAKYNLRRQKAPRQQLPPEFELFVEPPPPPLPSARVSKTTKAALGVGGLAALGGLSAVGVHHARRRRRATSGTRARRGRGAP